MEAPGLSLFQASDIIQIGTNTNPGQEEEEEQEDFKRRNEEVSEKKQFCSIDIFFNSINILKQMNYYLTHDNVYFFSF